ncbi:hypothetical protein PVAP13_6NG088800 [Panicum virgatum]|uniref:Uncharacterized protein n=1 Tax=Panicum virgatum TaxID=38727 RepID=A0A8T0QVZ3_PANVG|nr:hypothetical protein PVAP13_6NG088800 [Panicum virgatum]
MVELLEAGAQASGAGARGGDRDVAESSSCGTWSSSAMETGVRERRVGGGGGNTTARQRRRAGEAEGHALGRGEPRRRSGTAVLGRTFPAAAAATRGHHRRERRRRTWGTNAMPRGARGASAAGSGAPSPDPPIPARRPTSFRRSLYLMISE